MAVEIPGAARSKRPNDWADTFDCVSIRFKVVAKESVLSLESRNWSAKEATPCVSVFVAATGLRLDLKILPYNQTMTFHEKFSL